MVEPRLPLAAARPARVDAGVRPLVHGAATVAWFRLDPGPRPGDADWSEVLGQVDAEVISRTVRVGVEAGLPVVGVVRGAGSHPGLGVETLHAWGQVARSLAEASGQVPVVVVVDGPCVGGPALLLGLADVVVLTDAALAYVSEPAAVERITGVAVDPSELGGPQAHSTGSGVAHVVVDDLADALALVADLLDLLPPNRAEPAPLRPTADPFDRPCRVAAAAVPSDGRRSYEVRDVIGDLVDDGDVLELRERFGSSVVTCLARIGGAAVGIVANQPCRLAGALDIEGSQKAARFVRWCDTMNLPIVTLVDTPGFRPGRDQEWRGMIRHGAQLAFAYAEASVPRLCVLLRKAYGGAFIVMDCKTMGNDCCVAWPTAEVAVMGAAGAVEVLHRRRLAAMSPEERAAEQALLVAAYESTHLSPRVAAERGYVDAVIDPLDTRKVLAQAVAALRAKRPRHVARRHSNTPC